MYVLKLKFNGEFNSAKLNEIQRIHRNLINLLIIIFTCKNLHFSDIFSMKK